MAIEQLFIGAVLCIGNVHTGSFFIVVPVIETGCHREQQGDFIRVFNDQLTAQCSHCAAGLLARQGCCKANAMLSACTAGIEDGIWCTWTAVVIIVLSAVNSNGQRNTALLVGSDVQYHNLVWIGNEQFPNIIDLIHIKLYSCQCLFQIQAAAILTGFSLYLLVNFQVTQWHIVPCIGCYTLHFFKGNFFCCLNVFFCEEFADFQKAFIGIWVVAFSFSA